MSVRMRHTKAHTANRRSHHGLAGPRLSVCEKCKALHIRHRMCDVCGTYRGREVVDVLQKVTKKEGKKQVRANHAAEAQESTKAEKHGQPLDPKVLSSK